MARKKAAAPLNSAFRPLSLATSPPTVPLQNISMSPAVPPAPSGDPLSTISTSSALNIPPASMSSAVSPASFAGPLLTISSSPAQLHAPSMSANVSPASFAGSVSRISSSPAPTFSLHSHRPLSPSSFAPPNKKKCARKTSKTAADDEEKENKKPRWTWSKEETEELLQLRFLDERIKNKFINSKSKNDKSRAWAELTMRFNDRRQLSQTTVQLQKKVEKLVAEFRQIAADEVRTGNDVAPTYPEYWPVLAECLRGRTALEGGTLADSNGDVEKSDEEEDEEDEQERTAGGVAQGKGKAAKGNTNLASALETGMKAVASALGARTSSDPTKIILAPLNSGFEQIVNKLEEQSTEAKESSAILNATLTRMTDILVKLSEKLDK